MEQLTMSNLKVTKAKPSLFRPFHVNTLEVDSIVKASRVAQAITTNRESMTVASTPLHLS